MMKGEDAVALEDLWNTLDDVFASEGFGVGISCFALPLYNAEFLGQRCADNMEEVQAAMQTCRLEPHPFWSSLNSTYCYLLYTKRYIMVHLLLNYSVFGHMFLGTRYFTFSTICFLSSFCLPRISTPSIRGRGKRLETFRSLLSSQRSLQNGSFATVATKWPMHASLFATKDFSPSIGHATSTWSVVLWLATDQAEVAASHARCYWVLVPIDAWFCVTPFTVSEVEWKCILFRQSMSIFREFGQGMW